MPRLVHIAVVLLGIALFARCADAATLQQLSMDQMSQSATSIVRASVTGSYTSVINSTIYTHYKLQVRETWKGSSAVEVLLPGGVANGLRQAFPGVPALSVGSEYVLFLWKSSSTGIVHVIGLTQGIYNVSGQADGSTVAWRPKIGEMMLDSAGKRVADQAVSIDLNAMRLQVRKTLGTAGIVK